MRVNNTPTFVAGTTLSPNLRVKLDSGKLVVAGAAENEIGTTNGPALAADKPVAIIPRGEAGVRKMVAAGEIAKYAEVFAAADGKIDDAGTLPRGIAMEAASGDGSVINVLAQTETAATS